MIIIIIIIIDGNKGRTPEKICPRKLLSTDFHRRELPSHGQIQLKKFWQQTRPPCRPSEKKLIESLFPLKSLFH